LLQDGRWPHAAYCSARERLFGFTNGQTGANNPQGFVHLIKDGHAAQDAAASNTALINALRHGGDLLNVFGDLLAGALYVGWRGRVRSCPPRWCLLAQVMSVTEPRAPRLFL
jgi:hypothetical protein